MLDFTEDEDKVLLQRESSKRDRTIQNSLLRESMYQLKAEGYNKMAEQDSILMRVFLGYLSEVNPDGVDQIIDHVAVCIKKETVRLPLVTILSRKVKDFTEILKILKSHCTGTEK